MKKKALIKDFFIEIKNSFSRFISIFFIVALGVAFFAGIRSTKPDMHLSADKFYQDSNLMDIRIVSTLGLTEDDVDAISQIPGVKEVWPAYQSDVLCNVNDKEYVVKMMTVPEHINKVTMEAGRLPNNNFECIVDRDFLKDTGYQIGDKIKLKSGTDEPISDTLKNNEFTIVGSCITSYYLSYSKGSSAIGTGEVSSFIMIRDSVFAMDVFTEIYVTVTDAENFISYSENYRNSVDKVIDVIKAEIKDKREQARYEDIIKEARVKLDNAKKELEEAKEETDKELKKGKEKLEAAEQKINDGREELIKTGKKIKDGKKELSSGKEKIKEAWQSINEKERDIIKAKQEIEKGEAELEIKQSEFNKNKVNYDNGIKKIEKAEKELAATEKTLLDGQLQIDEVKKTLEEQEINPTLPADTIEQMRISVIEKEAELEEGRIKILNAKELLSMQKASLVEGKPILDAAKMQLNAAYKKLNSSKNAIINGEQKIINGKKELIEREKQIKTAEEDLLNGEREYLKAKEKLKESEEKLVEGLKEFEDGRKEAEKKIADAEDSINTNERKLTEIKKPKWFVLSRDSLQSYVEFGQDADRIGAIGEVFPIIFFLVAALVSLTTMTRMVEEQRTQIGTLKALGYNKFSIAAKYMGYALLATLSGSLFGGIIGCLVLPRVIITTYQIMYRNLPTVVVTLNKYYIFIAAIIAISCVLSATIMACAKELRAVPAELMRPAAPKQGKRILLERIPFIWKRLSFIMKSAARNLFRYKKRFFMTIFGIGGCMALMLVGFGLKDSIYSITSLQYRTIHVYDGTIQLNDDASISELNVLSERIINDKRFNGIKYQYQTSVDAHAGKNDITSNLVVFEDVTNLDSFIIFKDRITDEYYQLNDYGVIITEKLAKLLDVTVGDKISIKSGENKIQEVSITAISENYVHHYIYMTKILYYNLYGELPVMNQILFNDNSLSEDQRVNFETELLQYQVVSDVFLTSSVEGKFGDMLGSLDIVILVLIISAGGLAFVVLYNLNNISINERKRELATLKVLGFYDLEVSEYIYRENVVLTVIGIGIGIVLGIVLHRFVIVTCEVDVIMFGRIINTKSYIYSIILTFLFALLINLTMHFKLKKVDMTSSLKSME